MAKSRLQEFIAKHEQAAAVTNGFAHEMHLDLIQLAKILAVEFDHKKDKAKTDLERLFGGKIPSQKELLFLKYPNCAICGKKFYKLTDATKDHIKPKAKGGKNEITNYQLLCGPCNSRKGDYYDPDKPNDIVYKKNRANIRFMLEESNFIDEIMNPNMLEDAYKVWNYLWPQSQLTVKSLKRAHFKLVEYEDINIAHKGQWRAMPVLIGNHTKSQTPEVIEGQMNDWCEDANRHTTLEEIKQDHIRFEYIHPFTTGNGRLGRLLMNWQLCKAGLPLEVILSKNKEEYFKTFKGIE